MTEQEWLSNTDPAAMMAFARHDQAYGSPLGFDVSDRKAAMFVCACARLWAEDTPVNRSQIEGIENLEHFTTDALQEIHPLLLGSPIQWAQHWAAKEGYQEEKADLLREIIGNPFAKTPYYVDDGKLWWETGDSEPGSRKWTQPCWLTPTVVAIAEAAYRERLKVRCGACKGKGRIYTGMDGMKWIECVACHGTGFIDTGTLDPDRLAVLADALEDAGCEDGAILEHLRPKLRQRCPANCRVLQAWPHSNAKTHTYHSGQDDWQECVTCKGTGYIDVEPPTHVRGCWVVDLLTGST